MSVHICMNMLWKPRVYVGYPSTLEAGSPAESDAPWQVSLAILPQGFFALLLECWDLAALPAWLFTWISHIWVQMFMLNVVVMPSLLGPASVLGIGVCFSLKPPPFYGWKPPWVQTPSRSTVSFLYLGFNKVFLPQPPKWGVTDCRGHQLALQLFEYYFPNVCEDWIIHFPPPEYWW